MLFQCQPLASPRPNAVLVVEHMARIHTIVPRRGLLAGAVDHAPITIDLSEFADLVELIDRSELATPAIRKERRHIVEICAYDGQIKLRGTLKAP